MSWNHSFLLLVSSYFSFPAFRTGKPICFGGAYDDAKAFERCKYGALGAMVMTTAWPGRRMVWNYPNRPWWIIWFFQWLIMVNNGLNDYSNGPWWIPGLVNIQKANWKPWPSRNSGFYPLIAWWFSIVAIVTLVYQRVINDYSNGPPW